MKILIKYIEYMVKIKKKKIKIKIIILKVEILKNKYLYYIILKK